MNITKNACILIGVASILAACGGGEAADPKDADHLAETGTIVSVPQPTRQQTDGTSPFDAGEEASPDAEPGDTADASAEAADVDTDAADASAEAADVDTDAADASPDAPDAAEAADVDTDAADASADATDVDANAVGVQGDATVAQADATDTPAYPDGGDGGSVSGDTGTGGLDAGSTSADDSSSVQNQPDVASPPSPPVKLSVGTQCSSDSDCQSGVCGCNGSPPPTVCLASSESNPAPCYNPPAAPCGAGDDNLRDNGWCGPDGNVYYCLNEHWYLKTICTSGCHSNSTVCIQIGNESCQFPDYCNGSEP
jgi:hypothetical protein